MYTLLYQNVSLTSLGGSKSSMHLSSFSSASTGMYVPGIL